MSLITVVPTVVVITTVIPGVYKFPTDLGASSKLLAPRG